MPAAPAVGRRAVDDGELAYQFAEIHAARGESELAFQQLARAVETRDPGLGDLLVAPVFDGMRKDPRFADIIRRAGFPPG
ncbi:MAG: TPR end-of-group domain-containing protein [Thermaurantiacus sp.]